MLPCITCTSPAASGSSCLSCTSGYYLGASNTCHTCIANCLLCYPAAPLQCSNCTAGWVVSATTKVCVCAPGYFLTAANQCVTQCPTGYSANSVNMTCSLCPTVCQTVIRFPPTRYLLGIFLTDA